MTKATFSLREETLTAARRHAQQSGMSLSAWVDQATRREAMRADFEQYAQACRQAGLYSAEHQERHARFLTASRAENAS
jgi:hypothetical protein